MADKDYTTKPKLTVEDKLAIARNRRGTADPAKDQNAPAALARLPIWPDSVCCIPNAFLRSALFGAIRQGQKNRGYISEKLIPSLEGLIVRYKGELLDQGDLTTWATLIHVARLQALGSQCRITSYALLKLMGKTDTGKNRETLHSRIMRLRANAVEIKQGRHTYIGGFISSAYKDEETQEWIIEIDAKIQALFSPDQFTQIDWAIRYALDGQQLAQWLHGFYATHAKPFPVKVETLHQLCGSEQVVMSDYAKKLRKALDAVAETSTAHGQPFSYQIIGDLVHVEKKGSGPQRRHLAAKKPARTPRKPRA